MRRVLFGFVLSVVIISSGYAECPLADINQDCRVNILDMQILAEQWLDVGEGSADLTGDDRVNNRDLTLMGNQWRQAGIPLAINEFMASNSQNADPQGETDDWIEIYNYGDEAIDLASMYLTDDLDDPFIWRFPSGNPALTTIPAGGYLVVWADNDTGDSGLHAAFKLDAEEDEIGLFDSDGVTLVDSIAFGEQTGDISYGRYPDANDHWQFMPSPSIGQPNIGIYIGLVEGVKFSHDRGFYDAPFSVTIATDTEDTVIFYTLDGSDPFTGGSAYFYTGPITITGTTTLRAGAAKTGWQPSAIDTQTYIFVSDVVVQSPNGEAPGSGWPSYNVNGQVLDYGMDPDVVNNSTYADLMDDALLAIPTISLVTDLDNLFSASTGIYVNADQDGSAWERPVSVELINPDGREGFQINAGLRIRGAFSRSDSNPKHAFRLFFRTEYGAAKLRYPLFDDEGVDEFDKVDLRTSQNYSWSFEGSNQNTFIRDVFSRDVQHDMGQPYTRSRYYHLYINGHYWGLYQTEERPDAGFAASYLGGEQDQYDVIKNDSSGSRVLEATDGTMDAYRRLYDDAVAGFDSDAAYLAVQGLQSDGTPDSAGERLLNPENLMDYMICTYFTGDPDAPVSCWGHFSNNVFASYNRVQPEGFTWYRHDAEHSLGANGGVTEGRLLTDPTDRSIGELWQHFNPAWLHLRLTENPHYLMEFSDRVHKYLDDGGLLSSTENIQRWTNRANQINLAIIAESARWGDSKRTSPRTKADWEGQNTYMTYTFFPSRNQIVLDQMRSVDMYPNAATVSFNQEGGEVSPGFQLLMSQNDGTTGTTYYSVDGNDPGQPAEVQVSTTTLFSYDAPKRVLVPTAAVDDAWRGGQTFDDSSWMYSSGLPGGIGYERNYGYDSRISLDVESLMYGIRESCYVRIPFTISGDPSQFNFMAVNMRYDDGFVVYINGVQVAVELLTGTPTWTSHASGNHEDSGPESFDLSQYVSALQQGENILAIHALNYSTTSSDFLIAAELTAGSRTFIGNVLTDSAIEYTAPVTLNQTTHVMARVLSAGQWGPRHEKTFAVSPIRENLRITEIMYHPDDPADPNDPNEEYIELQNTGNETINLNLVRFTNGIDFTFPALELAAGEHVVVVQDRTSFEARYGGGVNIAGQYTGRLDNGGEKIKLEDAIGQIILEFSYKDGWRSNTDGDGFSLTAIDPMDPDPNGWGEKDFWRSSAYLGGSPGYDDSAVTPAIPNPGAVVINEVLAHSHATAADWVELYNTTPAVIDISGWFLSDSKDTLTKYEIPASTTIDPYDYIVFREDLHFNNPGDPGCHEPFALSENGDQLYLCSGNGGVVTGYRNAEEFGASATGVSFGRYYKSSTDSYNFVPMAYITQGSANADPQVGPIVITEIMYNPDWPAGGAYTNDQYEFVEICNISSQPVTLYSYDENLPWRFTNGVDFTFPDAQPVTMAAGQYLLIVKNIDAFSWRYPTVPTGKIVGTYSGQLSNGGERLELSMPGDIDSYGVRHYIRVDRVVYSDGSNPEDNPDDVDLWPSEADGGGKSLTRQVLGEYGNDPANWIASTPSPGQ